MDFSEITLDVAGDIDKAIAAILREGISPDKKIELVADVLKQTGRELHSKLYSLSSEVFGSAAMLSGGYGAEMADQAERLAVKIVRNSALNRQTAAMLLKEYCDVVLAAAQHEAFTNAKSMQKHPTLTRRANVGKPDCAWCQKKAGVYVDPTSDDFKRHHKCDCVFEVSGYNSRNGVLKNFKKG